MNDQCLCYSNLFDFKKYKHLELSNYDLFLKKQVYKSIQLFILTLLNESNISLI